jgi:hypothetical protein
MNSQIKQLPARPTESEETAAKSVEKQKVTKRSQFSPSRPRPLQDVAQIPEVGQAHSLRGALSPACRSWTTV